jgi:type II secretory pathway pseudopilin PulG
LQAISERYKINQSNQNQNQAVQQQVAAYASGNYPTQHQYGQYGQSDYSNSYYGSYGSGSGGQDVGQQQPKTDYNWLVFFSESNMG